jgi:hypothetical protein
MSGKENEMKYKKELKQMLLDIGVEERTIDDLFALRKASKGLRRLYLYFKTHGHLEFCPGGIYEVRQLRIKLGEK